MKNNFPLQLTELSYLENLLINLEPTKGGAVSSKSHLKNGLYDWRVEKQWDSPRAKVLNLDNKGFMFISFTKREPRHCTLRHFFVLEEYRGTRIGEQMMHSLIDEILIEKVKYLRFFANKPSIGFYEKLGYQWHGLSKTGLPFTYWDCEKWELAPLPKSQKRYVVQHV